MECQAERNLVTLTFEVQQHITVKIMSVIIDNIHKGPFSQYLRISEKIGGVVYEQSKLVDIVFLLEKNFLSIIRKYKKPFHEQEQNIFIEPISIQIRRIQRLKDNNLSSVYISHLNLINETVKIFEWTKYTNIEEFVQQIRNNTSPYLKKLENELLKLDTKHIDWIYSWNGWLEGISRYVVDFYKDGLIWGGTEKLPTYLLGDIPEIFRKLERLKLFQEINQGENIIQILRQAHDNTNEEEEE